MSLTSSKLRSVSCGTSGRVEGRFGVGEEGKKRETEKTRGKDQRKGKGFDGKKRRKPTERQTPRNKEVKISDDVGPLPAG